MTTVAKTPPDILKQARQVGAAMYQGEQWSHMRTYYLDGMYDDHPVVKAAAIALMAERSRGNAVVAETATCKGGLQVPASDANVSKGNQP